MPEGNWAGVGLGREDNSQGVRTEPLAWPRVLGASGMLVGKCTLTLFTLTSSVDRENNFSFSLEVL